jgi:hypothetical protein
MNQIKYIGMDVQMATTVIAIRDSNGKILTEAIEETKASTLLDFLRGQRGTFRGSEVFRVDNGAVEVRRLRSTPGPSRLDQIRLTAEGRRP